MDMSVFPEERWSDHEPNPAVESAVCGTILTRCFAGWKWVSGMQIEKQTAQRKNKNGNNPNIHCLISPPLSLVLIFALSQFRINTCLKTRIPLYCMSALFCLSFKWVLIQNCLVWMTRPFGFNGICYFYLNQHTA